MEVLTVNTKAYGDQKPGTSGLRKNTRVFMEQEHYTENFIQAILTSIDDRKGCTLVVGGDGRYYMDVAIKLICQIAAANGVGRLIIGENGILSTPAVSCLIRKHKAAGGIILTASHNPGGPDADFGIKFNGANGGPASSTITDRIFAISKEMTEFQTCPGVSVDLSKKSSSDFKLANGDAFKCDVISSTDDYVKMMKEIFDFTAIKNYVKGGENLKVVFDSLHGVMGPYARAVVCDELGCPESALANCHPKPDFNGGHPDPNLTYARDLVDLMSQDKHDFGVAFDGDGDRNMIVGRRAFFVSPCDSLAVIAANSDLIPYFKKSSVKGFARSMPTSGAVDLVAAHLGAEMFETPTGWKFFGNLMDAGRIVLCGEESFGTGSAHVREKDGMWAALAWLSVLSGLDMSVEEVLKRHWRKFGRNCFTRYDYEQVSSNAANTMMTSLRKMIEDEKMIDEKLISTDGRIYKVKTMDDYRYQDPIDGSIATKQGIRIIFSDGSRLIYRLSGTGSSGATIRMYIDSYVSIEDKEKLEADASIILAPLVEIGLNISQIPQLTGRDSPTVIT